MDYLSRAEYLSFSMFGEFKKYRASKLYDLSRDHRSPDEAFLLKDRKDSLFRKLLASEFHYRNDVFVVYHHGTPSCQEY